jgi:hypothetical protein
MEALKAALKNFRETSREAKEAKAEADRKVR